jgi:structural maintenance of chromosome 3 (chondroitin sulfate proteoglycan 6)
VQLDAPKKASDSGLDVTEVRIRRTIGLKKDQILVNNSPYSNADFQNLLESAGMSRSNPYYIVQQGRINHLMKQKKSERLGLFQEIAGTRTYDDRRAESLKIMKETDGKREQIRAIEEVLEGRLVELEEEAVEFNKFTVSRVAMRLQMQRLFSAAG